MIGERAAPGEAIAVFRGASPLVRRVGLDQPWVWIGRGWKDLMAAPRVGFGYGATFVVAGFAIALALYVGGSIYLLVPLAAGFMLLAPLFAVGLYETSRRLEAGEPADLTAAMLAFRANPEHIAYMGLVLMLLNLFWTRMATLIFAIFFGVPRTNLQDLADLTLFSAQSLPFLIVGTLVGFVLAAVSVGGYLATIKYMGTELNEIRARQSMAEKTNYEYSSLMSRVIALNEAMDKRVSRLERTQDERGRRP